jgi:Flp pilus assembly protein TadG
MKRIAKDEVRRNRLFCRHDAGSVTAEFAVVLPAVMVVALVLLSLGRAVLMRVECQEAARSAAQVVSTSQKYDAKTLSKATSAAHAVSPLGRVALSETAHGVGVRVTCPILPGPLGIFPAQVEGHAAAIKQEEVLS